MTELIVACPTCQKSVHWNNKAHHRPFCSERCKLIDLGEWANEEKRIAGEPLPEYAQAGTDEDIY